MKSVLGTFLIFFAIFALMKMNIIGVLNSGIFHIISYAGFIVVIICAVCFVGLPTFGKKKNAIKKISQERQDKDES